MADTIGSIESYLKRLAANLEALGPDATSDVVAEVRAHLAEALADEQGNEAAALARFGSAEALATSVLEERGILSGASAVPEAPSWMRVSALAADVALWLAALAIVLIPALGFPFYAGSPPVWVMVLAWSAIVLVVGGTGWWRVAAWRRPSGATMGMRLLGVRRIRLGERARIVRRQDVPGLGRERRLWPLFVTALALLVLASVISSVTLSSRAQLEAEISQALNNSSTGRRMVDDMYASVVGDAVLGDLNGIYAPTALEAVKGLLARRQAGKVDSYFVGDVALGDYEERLGSQQSSSTTIVVYVTMKEVDPKRSDDSVAYRWKVVCEMVDEGGGISSGEWLIDSAELLTE